MTNIETMSEQPIINLIISILIVLILPPCSFTSHYYHCLQNRPESQIQDQCREVLDDICSMIRCPAIESCDESDNNAIVANITGRGCCSACVHYLKEGEKCDISSRLKKCHGGLICDPNAKICLSPSSENRCAREDDNRQLVVDNNIIFYIRGRVKSGQHVHFELAYADDLEMVNCDKDTGDYLLKQCRGNKCFCVEPESGKYTFGLVVKDSESAQHMTCKCAHHFQDRLVANRVDSDYMQFFAEVHQKCDSTGNFARLQCVNQTCFCADRRTGKPDSDHVAMYGALSTLPCFDTEKAKQLISKDADLNYQNECERQAIRTYGLSLHFLDKGTKLMGLEKASCSFDGRFQAKQCKPGLCNCVTPDTCDVSMGGVTYGVDRTGGKDADMNCRCAREVYYASVEKKGYSRLQCDGSGNYRPFQSFNDGKQTFCVDENGSRISRIFNTVCLFEFLRSFDAQVLPDEMCRQMRLLLTDRVLEAHKYYIYDLSMAEVVTVDDKPLNLFCDNNSNKLCC